MAKILSDTDKRTANLQIDGLGYDVEIWQPIVEIPEAPRLIVVSYQPNEKARDILQACIQAIQRYTHEPYELWVIDNHSPKKNTEWLLQQSGINLVLNRTEPIPPDYRGLRYWVKGQKSQRNWGSYANAIALEIAARLVDPQTQYLMTLHMDTMPCRVGWLSFLKSKISDRIAASGVRLDKARTPEGVLHVLGYLVDFQLFKQLNLDFMPQLPQYDVGDRVTVKLREAGYDVFACHNTLWEPQLVEKIPSSSPIREMPVDRAFDDNNNVIFLHLGRGVKKASGGQTTGMTSDEWVKAAKEYILA